MKNRFKTKHISANGILLPGNSLNFKFIRIMALAIVILFLSQIAKAQDTNNLKGQSSEQRATSQTSFMKSKLNLDIGQVEKVQAVNLKYAQKMEPILTSNDSRMSRLKQAKRLMNAKDGELKSVLTAGQYQQYQDLKAEMKQKLKDNMTGNN